nr:MAG: structural polyprotein [Mamastrovirus 3]
MANQKNVQPKVVTTTTTTTSRRRGRRRRRTPRTSTPNKTTVRKVAVFGQPRRPFRRRFNRPGNFSRSNKTMFSQKITATLGTVGANQGDRIELEMSALISPALMKESTGSNAYGPIQMYAANYNLWRIKYMTLKLNPLVGGSAVSGTAIRASLNLSGQPGSPNWSALGARMHKDTNPGRPLIMRIPGKALLGPKDGWFLCNTKNDPQLCIGGSLEIHSYGKTMSTYKSEVYNGPLFLAELEAEWQFKNYNPEPGMANLVKMDIKEDPQQVKIHSSPGEPILMSIPAQSSMSKAILQTDIAADATASEIIWQICDAAIDAASPVFPPPFSWLFKCGWWFIKRIANKNQSTINVQGVPNAGELTFQVFQSISDAQNGVPCISTGATSTTTNATINQLQLTQITPGNTGVQQETLAGLRRTIEPTYDPVQISSMSLFGQRTLYGHIHKLNNPPQACFVMQGVTNDKKVYSFSVRQLKEPVFTQNGAVVKPDEIGLPSYPIKIKEGGKFTDIGRVYMAAHFETREITAKVYWTTACWKATISKRVKLQSNGNNTNDRFLFFSPRQTQAGSSLPLTIYELQVSQQMSLGETYENIEKGDWYVSTFVAVGNSTIEFTNYGVPYYISKTVEINAGSYEPTLEAYNVGAMMNTATPLTLKLNVAQDQNLTSSELAQLRQLLAGAGVPASLNPELPLLEEEEEEEELQGVVDGVVRERTPTPYPKEEEEDDDESDLDDDDYAEAPSVIKNLLTPKAKALLNDLQRMGLSHDKAVKAAQGAYPHPALDLWDAAYHNALADGLSPPSARDCAWGAVADYLS